MDGVCGCVDFVYAYVFQNFVILCVMVPSLCVIGGCECVLVCICGLFFLGVVELCFGSECL